MIVGTARIKYLLRPRVYYFARPLRPLFRLLSSYISIATHRIARAIAAIGRIIKFRLDKAPRFHPKTSFFSPCFIFPFFLFSNSFFWFFFFNFESIKISIEIYLYKRFYFYTKVEINFIKGKRRIYLFLRFEYVMRDSSYFSNLMQGLKFDY